MAYTQRTTDWVINRAYVHAQRKTTPPAQGTDKYNTLLAIVDSVQKDWADEPGIEWDVLFSRVNNGAVTATDTFPLDPSINYISKREDNPVLLVSPDGTQKVPYRLVAPNQLYKYRYSHVVAQVGRNLVFSSPFQATDSYIGYTIQVPSILYVSDIVDGTTLIQCPDPLYVAYMTAAEFDRNDVVKMGQYNNLVSMAENKMQKMKANNSGAMEEIPMEPFVYGQTWL